MTLCTFCDEPATLACDYVLGRDAATCVELCEVSDTVYRCDLLMCRSCAEFIASLHFKTPEGGEYDTVDLCRYHSGTDVSENIWQLISEADAQEVRDRIVHIWSLGHRTPSFRGMHVARTKVDAAAFEEV